MISNSKLATLIGASLLLAATATGAKPVKVFILAGQSNMDGQAEVRTIDFLGEDKDPARASLLKTFKPDGVNFVTRDDVWVAYRGYHHLQTGLGGGGKDYSKPGKCIGPEYAFGYYMGQALDEQVLLLKFGPGGTSLYQNWRPPSAGVPEGMKPEDAGFHYRAMVESVHETLTNLKQHFPEYNEKDGYEIVGFVWFQGFNDMIGGGAPVAEYASNLTCLIKDLRKEFKAPEMKVVVGVMGVNGMLNETDKQGEIRNKMRAMNKVPEFKGNVRAIETAPLLHPDVVALRTTDWFNNQRDLKTNPITPEEKAMLARATSNKGFHYFGEGRFFILLGKAFADTMLELMGRSDGVLPPKLNDFLPPNATREEQ
ncbi:MAG: sialate O-acetylesterase [Verrucomicrobiota bacterium]